MLKVDNRGMANRGRAFALPIKHHLGPTELDDQMAALKQALQQFRSSIARVSASGAGATADTSRSTPWKRPTMFKAGVSVAPVTDWRNYDSIYTERYMGLPKRQRRRLPQQLSGKLRGRSARQPARSPRHQRRQRAHAEHDPDGECFHQCRQAVSADAVSAQNAWHRRQAARSHLFHMIEDHFETDPGAREVRRRPNSPEPQVTYRETRKDFWLFSCLLASRLRSRSRPLQRRPAPSFAPESCWMSAPARR